jgi:molybdopterin synthase sulfur carrier subunit
MTRIANYLESSGATDPKSTGNAPPEMAQSLHPHPSTPRTRLPTHVAQTAALNRQGDSVGLFSSDSVTVRLPAALLTRTGGRKRVISQGRTVREVVETLERDYPGLRFHICHETGELRPYVNVFLEEENVRYLQGLDTEVPEGATLHIIHSVAGGQ